MGPQTQPHVTVKYVISHFDGLGTSRFDTDVYRQAIRVREKGNRDLLLTMFSNYCRNYGKDGIYPLSTVFIPPGMILSIELTDEKGYPWEFK